MCLHRMEPNYNVEVYFELGGFPEVLEGPVAVALADVDDRRHELAEVLLVVDEVDGLRLLVELTDALRVHQQIDLGTSGV